MRKLSLIVAALSLSLVSNAQNTLDIYARGAAGSFTTGSSTAATRTDNAIRTTTIFGNATRGYAVFDLSSIPSTADVTSVELYFNKATVTGGSGSVWNTRGYAGDLSTFTTAATLFPNMVTGPVLYTTSYGTTAGNMSLVGSVTADTFVENHIGEKISIVWTTNSSRLYTITGETGTATTTGAHAPYIRVNYDCPNITSIGASGPAADPCPNEPFALSGTTTGTITSYSWSGPGGFSSTSLTPTVSTGLPATGVYTFTATDPGGCRSSATVTVNVNPAPFTNINVMTSQVFCADDSCTLEAPIVPGYVYQWYEGTTAIAGATDAQYAAHITGNYRVEVTDANGCVSITAAPTPTLLLDTPSVTPGGPILLCAGDNGILSVNTNGITSGLNFQWQRDGVDITGANSNMYDATVSGTYRVEIGVTAGTCATVSREVVVDINTYPTPVITSVAGTLTTTGAYAVYQWFLNTVAIPGSTSATYTPTTPGSYRVRVTDANGCTAFSGAFNTFTSSVSALAASDIMVYPNPTSNELFVSSPIKVKAVLTNIHGQQIAQMENTNIKFQTENLPSGCYFVSIYSASGDLIDVRKIAKQ